MENKDKETFYYTYCAKEAEEIKAIRKKYAPLEEKEDKLQQLRRLDASVVQKAKAISLVFGVIGALVLGTGMSLVMTDIGKSIGLGEALSMIVGIPMGVLGIALVGIAYPVYNRIIKKEREKIAPMIIKLTDELMK